MKKKKKSKEKKFKNISLSDQFDDDSHFFDS
jgi:hypothetical protein